MEVYQDLEKEVLKQKTNMIRKDKLYGWIFHFNPFKKQMGSSL